MIIEAIQRPIRYRWSGGEIRFSVNEPVHVEPTLGQRILKKCKGKVQLADNSPFYVGQRVKYRVPVEINSPWDYQWAEHVGLVEMIDHKHHLGLVIPETEPEPWRWINLTYVEPF